MEHLPVGQRQAQQTGSLVSSSCTTNTGLPSSRTKLSSCRQCSDSTDDLLAKNSMPAAAVSASAIALRQTLPTWMPSSYQS